MIFGFARHVDALCLKQLGRFLGSLAATPVWHAGGIALTSAVTGCLQASAWIAAMYILRNSDWNRDFTGGLSACTDTTSGNNSATLPAETAVDIQPEALESPTAPIAVN